MDQFLSLQVAARDAHRARSFAWRDDNAHAAMTAAAHCSASSIDHEAHQESRKQTMMMLATNVQGTREFLADNNNKQKMIFFVVKNKINNKKRRKE